jgi:hypothetical protein
VSSKDAEKLNFVGLPGGKYFLNARNRKELAV